MDEVGSQEVLGPYKRVGSVQALEAVPTEYRDYNNNRNRDDAHSAGNISYASKQRLCLQSVPKTYGKVPTVKIKLSSSASFCCVIF